jgi:hypothetical protein
MTDDLKKALQRFRAWKHYRETGQVIVESAELEDGMAVFAAYEGLEAALKDARYLLGLVLTLDDPDDIDIDTVFDETVSRIDVLLGSTSVKEEKHGD